jgi:hypothetical protein
LYTSKSQGLNFKPVLIRTYISSYIYEACVQMSNTIYRFLGRIEVKFLSCRWMSIQVNNCTWPADKQGKVVERWICNDILWVLPITENYKMHKHIAMGLQCLEIKCWKKCFMF